MDKRATRILLGCLTCTLIVLILFLIALRFSQLSCELVHVEQQNLRSSQLSAFNKDKPTRSEDKTILMKFSAYLEYDKPINDDDSENSIRKLPVPILQQQQPLSHNQFQQQNNTTRASNVVVAAAASGPSPSIPTNFLLNNANFSSQDQQQQIKKRFMPLKLESIETRHLNEPNKFKYILSFNCTKLHMVLARFPERVQVESMRLELKMDNKRKSECDIPLSPPGAFGVGIDPTTTSLSATNQTGSSDSDLDNNKKSKLDLVRYYCNRPQVYNCMHYSSSSDKSTGLHLVNLHINAIEFETSTGANELKSEFKSKRRECDITG